MMEEKTVRKIKRVILIILGVTTIVQLASYLPFWDRYILSRYINKINASFLQGIGGDAAKGLGYVLNAILLVFLVVFVFGIIQLMYTTRRKKWQKRITLGYRMLLAIFIIAFIYLMAGAYFYPINQKKQVAIVGERTAATLLAASYLLLVVFVFYKLFFAKAKMFDPVNLLLVVALVLAFLGGGILIPGARWKQTILFGGAQTMPIIFLIYFEFMYRPVLLTRKSRRRRRHHSSGKK